MKAGPCYGYHLEPSNSFIVVNTNYLDEAYSLFDDLNVNVVTSHRLLGGVVGESSERDSIEEWSCMVERLSVIASEQPQAAYVTFTRAVQNKWLYFQCERSILSFPTRLGGLNIINPTESGKFSYLLSRKATDVVINSLKKHTTYDPDTHINTLVTDQSEKHKQKELILDENSKPTYKN